MIPADDLLRMIADRAKAEPGLAVVEAVLLRAAFERLDDFVGWLELHMGTEHTDDPRAQAMLEVVVLIHRRLSHEVALVDQAMSDDTGQGYSNFAHPNT